MSTDLDVKTELDLMHHFNEPIGVRFTPDAVEVWHNNQQLTRIPQVGALVVKISHEGELVAVITPTRLTMWNIKANIFLWQMELRPPACGTSGHNLQFSKDDTQLLMTSYMLMLAPMDPILNIRPLSFTDTTLECDIFDVGDGSEIIERTKMDSAKMANKFSFDLNSFLLTSGFDIGNPQQHDLIDFKIVDLNKTGVHGEIDDGVDVRRFHERDEHTHGSVLRLIARRIDHESIFILCVRSNGGTIYIYNDVTFNVSPVGSFYIDPFDDERVIMNAGLSSDRKLIAILIEDDDRKTSMAFYDVEKMMNRFRLTVDDSDDDDNYDDAFDDKYDHFDVQVHDDLLLNPLIDREIFVSSKHMNATIYRTNSITTVFLDQQRVTKKILRQSCVSYSDPVNFVTQKIKQTISMAVCMGLHKRLGQGSNLSWLDEEMIRTIMDMSFHTLKIEQ